MQVIGIVVVLATIMINASLSTPITAPRDDLDGPGYPLSLDIPSLSSEPELLQESDNRGEKDVYVTPMLLWKLLQLSRLHQDAVNPKRSHYKQCAFNAVSCFG